MYHALILKLAYTNCSTDPEPKRAFLGFQGILMTSPLCGISVVKNNNNDDDNNDKQTIVIQLNIFRICIYI